MNAREKKLRLRCRDDFPFFAERCLKISVKEVTGGEALWPLKLNDAQEYAHSRFEAQKAKTGMVRAIVLKGRQQGISTLIEARNYHQTTHKRGVKAFIMTHDAKATANVFKMVERYHNNNNPLLRPELGKSNASELEFSKLDSRYSVATAGSKGAGRSQTIHFFHGSEVAFWENAEDHMAGALQAVPMAPGTEVILESTANGVGNEFHRLCMQALAGDGPFELIFIPWFWQREYELEPGADFQLSDSVGDVPEGELTEVGYATAYKLGARKMAWRRAKIAELGYWKFKQEYPATLAEAFQASGQDSFISLSSVVRARKRVIPPAGPLVIGVDPSHGINDGMGIIRRRTRTCYNPQIVHGLKEPQAAGFLARIIVIEKPHKMFIDVGGGGYAIIAILQQMPEIPEGVIVPVNFGDAAFDSERYFNKRAEMYGTGRDWLDDVLGADIPDLDRLQADLLAIGTLPDANQRLKLEPKHAVKKKLNGISTDIGDAWAVTFAYPITGELSVPKTSTHGLDGWPIAGQKDNSAVPDFDPFEV